MKSKVILCYLIFFVVYVNTVSAFEHVEVTDSGLVGDFYYKEGVVEQRPIIIFGGSDGGNFLRRNDRYRGVLEDLEKEENRGYAVLALSYFDYSDVGELPSILKEIPLEYFKTAIDWLAKQPGIHGGSVAMYGTSRGGELALLLASHFTEIDVVIAASPSAYVWGPYHRDPSVLDHEIKINPCGSAWTFRGEEIPSICSGSLASFDPWYGIIDEPNFTENAVIQVEKMSASTLLLSGKYDDVWPSMEMSNRIINRLNRFHYPHAHRHLVYAASHDVFWASWKDVLLFLKEHFPAQSGKAAQTGSSMERLVTHAAGDTKR
ncbi:MAG: acyl-CoA thioester hydrolase/BAAT C-terminal domain-containing protein [Pseudomonadota bacterium]